MFTNRYLMNWFCTQKPETLFKKSDQVIPFLKTFEWLPSTLRVKTMVLSMAYKTLHRLLSCCISEFITCQHQLSILLPLLQRCWPPRGPGTHQEGFSIREASVCGDIFTEDIWRLFSRVGVQFVTGNTFLSMKALDFSDWVRQFIHSPKS